VPANHVLRTSAASLLAAEGFAIWAVFSTLPFFTGRPSIREAWDTNAYWSLGIPVLLLSLAVAGAIGKESPWRLAAAAVAGHFVGVFAIVPPGNSLGLLPLTLVLIGVPMFAVLAGFGWAGRYVRHLTQPAESA
jgi:hypothetical protein